MQSSALDRENAIYTGSVRHRRFSDKPHQFQYQVFMMYCNVEQIDAVCRLSPLWSLNRRNIACFDSNQYLSQYGGSLLQRVNQALSDSSLPVCEGKVYLLANWRYWGYLINPICSYYCFSPEGELQAMVLEVTNTPWGQRQVYAIACDPKQSVQRLKFDKTMHVSPFYSLDMAYQLNCQIPSEKLSMHISNVQQDNKLFDATLALKRTPISAASLNKVLVSYPFMTMKVVTGIYWQALKLWLKGVGYYNNPHKTNAT